jgi:hypothetical protein
MLPIAAEIATRLTREQAQSARPHAPVIPVEETRPRVSLLSRVRNVAGRRRQTARNGQSSTRHATDPRQAW